MKIKYTWATMGNDKQGYLEHAENITKSRDYWGLHFMPLSDTKEEAIEQLKGYCVDEKYVNEYDNFVLLEVYNFRDEVDEAIKKGEE